MNRQPGRLVALAIVSVVVHALVFGAIGLRVTGDDGWAGTDRHIAADPDRVEPRDVQGLHQHALQFP